MMEQISKTSLDALVALQTSKIFANKDPKMPYVGLEHIAQGEPRLLGTANSASSYSANSVFNKDDILFGKLRPNLRKSVRAPFNGYCSTDILVLRSLEGVIPNFAGHVFQWERVFAAAVSTAAGTKMPRTSWNDLKYFKVFKPVPSEQSRIAYVLDTIDEAIAKTEAVIAKMKQVRTGMLHDLLSYEDTNLNSGNMPIKTKKLQEVADVYYGKSQKTVADPYGEYPIIGTGGFLGKAKIPLFYGPAIVVGRKGTLNCPFYCDAGFWPVDTTYAVIPKDGVHAKWLYYSLCNTRLDLLNEATGVPSLNRDRLHQVLVQDIAYSEQVKIVDTVEVFDRGMDAEEEVLKKLKVIKSGLMSDLLTGQVRVPETIAGGAEGL